MPGLIGGVYQGPQNWSDRLAIIGAALKDASPESQGGNLAQAQQMLMQRQMAQYQMQMLQGVNGLIKPAQPAQYEDAPAPSVQTPAMPGMFGAGAPAAPPPASGGLDDASGAIGGVTSALAPPPAPAPSAYHLPVQTKAASAGGIDLRDPQTQAYLARAAAIGLPGAKDLIELGKATMPSFDAARPGTTMYNKLTGETGRTIAAPQYQNGFLVDPTKPGAPTYLPQFDKMTMPDGRGGVMPLPGAIGATSDLAQATELGKTLGSPQTVPNSDGSSTLMLGRDYFGGHRGLPQVGAPGAPASGAVSGRTQTPAEKAYAEEQAKGLATRGLEQPQKIATLSDADRTTDFSRNTIHDILGETQDPKTGQWRKTKPSQVNFFTTGILGATDEIPGTPAHDLKAKLDTILSQTAVSELQKMRDESPTGGALGRVTQQEINMLAAMRGSIEQTQSGKQLDASLRHHLDQLDKLATIRDRLYAQQYPNGQVPQPGQVHQPAQASSGRVQPPQPGAVVKGYRFLGGNPADQNSWVRVQ